ncbi:MAG TPA: TIGR00730 family Rossman fold protein [Rectinemataceae bacterium]|nr:TIGR00730 family Rossman fold protein [Rectinemataceae bacterium]
MSNSIRSICVFCGSSFGTSPMYAEATALFARELAARGLRLVYGGGNIGLMGVLAKAAHEAGAEVIGVIPKKLAELVDQPELAELFVTDDMHGRKAKMAELADAFVALPGGTGTFEELFEAWTWRQIGYHGKPVGLLDVEGYWDPLLALLHHTAEKGFMRKELLTDLVVKDEAAALIDALILHPPLPEGKLPERHRQR